MAKMRVHEIAKQLNLASKDIIVKLQEMGVDAKSHMSNIDEADTERLMTSYRPKREARQNADNRDSQKQAPKADSAPVGEAAKPHAEVREAAVQGREQTEGAGSRDDRRQERDGQERRQPKDERPAADGAANRDGRPRQREAGDGQERQNGQRRERRPDQGQNADRQYQQGSPRRDRDFPRDGQRREHDAAAGQRREGQQGGGRREYQQGDGQRREGQQGDGQRREGQQGDGQRREGRQDDGQRREYQQGDSQRRDGQRRDGQQGDRQRRDGQQGDGQRRDRQQGDGQRRDGQQGDGQRRDGQQGDGQRRDGQQGDGQRRDGQQGGQRRDGQQGQGQRRWQGQQSGPNRDGERRDNFRRDNERRDGEGERRDGQQHSLSGDRQNIRRDGLQRQGNYTRRDHPAPTDREGSDSAQQREGQPVTAQGGEGQPNAYPRRDGQGQTGGYQRRDGQGQTGGYQRRDGQGQTGGYQRRDGQGQTGGYQRREGQGQTGSYPRRDGQGQTGSYPRRDGQGQTGSYPRRDGQGQTGGYPRRDGQGQTGGYPRRDGQGQTGGYPRRDGQGQAGGFQRRDGQGGFPKKDDSKPGFQRRDAKPAFGKKDDKKAAEQPSKDDRKQIFQKSEQMRLEKAKTKKETAAKESNQFYAKQTAQRKPTQQRKGKEIKKVIPIKTEPDIKFIKIPRALTVKELAEEMHRSGADVVKALMKLGVMAAVTAEIDFDTAVKVAETFNVMVEEAVEVDPFEVAFSQGEEAVEEKAERPPVVVVMGHVDHGKTSLLDAIRSTRVTETEAGGITQRIGAYTVSINGKLITFLDTPGHEAFTAMRMRGAQITDISVLVVAADDGVMPQTVEAINHAKAAGVDIIVAINKIDLPGANPDRVKQELTEHGILVEDWGGETISVNVSALQHTNIDRLLEMIIIVSEMKELRANPNKPARGTIIEAQLDKGRGAVATVLVQDGTLKVGDTVVAGACFGRIRAMLDDKGRKIKAAGPSIPVEILGLADVPAAGDAFYVAQNEKQARQLSDTVIAKGRVSMIKAMPQKVSLDDLFSQIQAGHVKDLNIVLKADVQGSVEAVRTSLEKLSNEEVRVQVIHGGVGAINESDVMLASTSSAIIIGFNVRPDANAKAMADAEKVDVRLYRVIYNALEDITAAMKGMLDPIFKEKIMGRAEIRQIFKASGVGTIGGSYVTDGKIVRSGQIRIIRDGKVVYDGSLETLRRFKDDVREVNSGYECGLLFSKFNDIKEGDIAEAYIMEEIPR